MNESIDVMLFGGEQRGGFFEKRGEKGQGGGVWRKPVNSGGTVWSVDSGAYKGPIIPLLQPMVHLTNGNGNISRPERVLQPLLCANIKSDSVSLPLLAPALSLSAILIAACCLSKALGFSTAEAQVASVSI